MQSQIYIKGFSRATTKQQLRNFFRNYEGIEDLRIIKDYAFIDFKTQEEAERAVIDKGGADLDGKKLRVQIAGKPKGNRGPQPGDQCRLCGKPGHWKRECSKFKRQRRRRRSRSSSKSSHAHRKKRSKRRSHKYSSSSSSSFSSSSSSRSSSSSSSESRSRSRSKKKEDKKK